MTDPGGRDRQAMRRRGTALAAGAVALGMLGLAYAAVPIYRLVCEVTGLGGTTQRVAANTGAAIARALDIRFDANTAPGLAWTFAPVQRQMRVRLGETTMAFFRATNTAGVPVTGTATFNVTPEIAGRFFNKIECFCFTEQTLQPGESVEMPVVFFVDPALVAEPGAEAITEITLSYTFFEAPAASG